MSSNKTKGSKLYSKVKKQDMTFTDHNLIQRTTGYTKSELIKQSIKKDWNG